MNDSSEPAAVGFCTSRGSGAALPAAGGEVLAEGSTTAGRLTVIRSAAPAGDRVPLHVHDDVDECFYVLAGHYRVTCGPDVFHAETGSLVFLPRGIPHSYTVGEQPGQKLIIGVLAGLEALFRDLDDEAVDLDQLQHRHRVTFL